MISGRPKNVEILNGRKPEKCGDHDQRSHRGDRHRDKYESRKPDADPGGHRHVSSAATSCGGTVCRLPARLLRGAGGSCPNGLLIVECKEIVAEIGGIGRNGRVLRGRLRTRLVGPLRGGRHLGHTGQAGGISLPSAGPRREGDKRAPRVAPLAQEHQCARAAQPGAGGDREPAGRSGVPYLRTLLLRAGLGARVGAVAGDQHDAGDQRGRGAAGRWPPPRLVGAAAVAGENVVDAAPHDPRLLERADGEGVVVPSLGAQVGRWRARLGPAQAAVGRLVHLDIRIAGRTAFDVDRRVEGAAVGGRDGQADPVQRPVAVGDRQAVSGFVPAQPVVGGGHHAVVARWALPLAPEGGVQPVCYVGGSHGVGDH